MSSTWGALNHLTGNVKLKTNMASLISVSFILAADYRLYNLNLNTNSFGGTKSKRNYIWGYANKKGSIPLVCSVHGGCGA
jgi:hypothetical protein